MELATLQGARRAPVSEVFALLSGRSAPAGKLVYRNSTLSH
jgi:hypothetical protein